MTMTINQFSLRTGLSPSTLRYYDKKDLLNPSYRSENGYRLYVEEQTAIALLIHSLRQADVAIEEIKLFLLSSEDQKNHLISKWQQEVESKLASIQIAKRYLGGIRPTENHIHLLKWNEPKTFIWFKHTVDRKIHPFQEAMKIDLDKVLRVGIRKAPGIFVKTLDATGDTMTGEVGFIVERASATHFSAMDDVYVEHIGPQLFATMDCIITDPFLCFIFIPMLQKYGFRTKGQKLERFDSVMDERFTYLIPLVETDSEKEDRG